MQLENNYGKEVYNGDIGFIRDINHEDNCMSLTNFSFDVSVAEIFLPLIFGAKLVLFDNSNIIDIIIKIMMDQFTIAMLWNFDCKYE